MNKVTRADIISGVTIMIAGSLIATIALGGLAFILIVGWETPVLAIFFAVLALVLAAFSVAIVREGRRIMTKGFR